MGDAHGRRLRIWPPASDLDWSSLPHVRYIRDPLDLLGTPPLP
jgi:hypothetical protein